MLYTCRRCGKITDQPYCPQHQPGWQRPDQRWKSGRNRSAQRLFREAVLTRDEHRCQRCGSTKDLVAAHWPRALREFAPDDPEAYDPRNGRCLCRACHRLLDPYAR
jgi:hypothetical protein